MVLLWPPLSTYLVTHTQSDLQHRPLCPLIIPKGGLQGKVPGVRIYLIISSRVTLGALSQLGSWEGGTFEQLGEANPSWALQYSQQLRPGRVVSGACMWGLYHVLQAEKALSSWLPTIPPGPAGNRLARRQRRLKSRGALKAEVAFGLLG